MATYLLCHVGVVVNAPATTRQAKCCFSAWRALLYILNEVTTFLSRQLSERRIGQVGSTSWHLPSPDRTPLEFFLCDFVEDEVYLPPKPIALNNLKDRIRIATEKTDHPLLQNAWHEIEYRLKVCRAANGAYTEFS
jgi:hypothetical protein